MAHAAPARKSPAPVKTAPKLDPQAQQEQRIRDLISGRKVLLKTRVGATIPILFDADGKVAHVWAKVRVNGHVDAVLEHRGGGGEGDA